MVFNCPEFYNHSSNNKYTEQFSLFSFELDHFQKWAIEAIEKQKHILITAHTGSGKSTPFEYAIKKWNIQEKSKSIKHKIIYTSPIKSLSNQKFYELKNKYPEVQFGILTGDIKFNPEADCLIMTTEILRNTLYIKQQLKTTTDDKEIEKLNASLLFDMDIENELACVIFDEVHYINDKDRGHVWEETIMNLPDDKLMILLSATIDKPHKFAEWIEKIKSREVWLATTNLRVVPLTHYSYSIYQPSFIKQVREMDKIMASKMDNINRKYIPICDNNGLFYDTPIKELQQINNFINKNRLYMYKNNVYVLNELSKQLKDENKLPAICFALSRKKVETYAKHIDISLFNENDEVERKYPSIIEKECKNIIMKLPNYKEYIELPEYYDIINILKKGVAIHHSGILPIFKEMIEILFDKGFIKLLFATETFAVGINMPTKTTIFTGLKKFDGSTFRYLMPHEYTQMAGRAGRRGLDTIGYVIHLNNLFELPELFEYKSLLSGIPQKLTSKFKVSFSLILKLLSQYSNNYDIDNTDFIQKSMVNTEIGTEIENIKNEIQNAKQQLLLMENYKNTTNTTTETLNEYLSLMDMKKYKKGKQLKNIERKMEAIENSNKTFKNDYKTYLKYIDAVNNLNEAEEELDVVSNYLDSSIYQIKELLHKHQFLNVYNDDANEASKQTLFKLTDKGIIASLFQELNGIVLSELFTSNKIQKLNTKELIMLFSLYSGIKVNDEFKCETYMSTYYIKNNYNDIPNLKNILYELNHYNDLYFNIELSNLKDINSDDYNISFDLLDILYEWVDSNDETTCRNVISKLYEKEIYIGDFVKAVLKINNISLEFQKVAQYIEDVELLHKLSFIGEKTLKYFVTNNSLYI